MSEENNSIDDLLGDIKGDIEKEGGGNSNIKNYESKKRRKSVKIILSDEQKKKLLEKWESNPSNPPSLKELVQEIFSGEHDGRSMEALAVKGFMSTLDINPRTNFEYQKVQVSPLTDEQKQYIANNCSTMTPFEMAKELYPGKNNLTAVSAETRQINEYMRSLPDVVLYQRKDDLPEFDDYHPPKNIQQAACRVNKYILNCIKSEDLEKDTKIKNCLNSLIKFCHMHRFVATYESYSKKSDRELFEGSYVRYVWIKDDLQQEELDLYINLCTDIVNLTNMQVELNDLIAMRTQCAEDSEGKRLSLSIVNSIKDVRAEMNESKKRAKNAVEALQGKRNERIDVKAKENASLIQLIDFWRVQESREIMVKLAKVRQQKIKNEIKRIENLDDLKAQVWGISPEEII